MNAEKQFAEDMAHVCNVRYIPWERLCGKTVFITGATGLIGRTLINALLYVNRERKLGLRIQALVRDMHRAQERFAFGKEDPALALMVGDVEKLPEIKEPVDYIVHGASQTASKTFVERPVETIYTALHGTENLLELAREKEVQGFVYLSSMEVYGHPQRGHKVSEDEIGQMLPLDVRNSYPISKVQCESLCCAYAKEYGVPAMCVRLTQTFGPGADYGDARVFAEFARCAVEKRDIILKTKGETERSYLYTSDAVTAILTILLKGASGQIYNAANEDTYCSIAEMAEMVARWGGIHVRYQPEEEAKNGYPQALYMDLDTRKLLDLGWKAAGATSLMQMYERMVLSW